jgi:hypothetical protein
MNDITYSVAEQDWNDKFYKHFKMIKSMEKMKHLDPKFSNAIERLVLNTKGVPERTLSKRSRTKTANRLYKGARGDDSTEKNRDFGNEYSISQDKTDYLAKQSDMIPDSFELASSTYFEDEVEKHSISQFVNDGSYNYNITSKF